MPKISESELKERYDRWHTCEGFAQDKAQKVDKFSGWILDLLKVQEGRSLLDVACGKGLFMSIAAKKGLEVSGIDVSEEAIKQARSITPTGATLKCGPAEHLPFPDDSFDYVICLGSLEHFLAPEIAVQEMSRVLKKDGLACIYVPNLYFLGHIYMAFRCGVEPSEAEQQFSEIFKTRLGWQAMLDENGFIVKKTYKYNTIWASRKVGRLTKILYNLFLKPFIPMNLSYSFVFICRKDQHD